MADPISTASRTTTCTPRETTKIGDRRDCTDGGRTATVRNRSPGIHPPRVRLERPEPHSHVKTGAGLQRRRSMRAPAGHVRLDTKVAKNVPPAYRLGVN